MGFIKIILEKEINYSFILVSKKNWSLKTFLYRGDFGVWSH